MAWYTKGTIAIDGATVTGIGTNWTDNKMAIGPGQALYIPAISKWFEILRVDSATKITLASSAGNVAAGSLYAILSFYTDSAPDFACRLAAQLGYYQSQMDGWQELMTGTGSVTLEDPNGQVVTISSFKKLTDDMSAKMEKSQNLNDVENKATARTNLGLTLISSTTDEIAGRVMTTGAAGLLARSTPLIAGSYNRYPSGFYRSGGGSGNVGYGAGVYCSYDETICFHIHAQGNGQLRYRYLNTGLITYDHTVYSTGNTIKTSDGSLKAASPIVKIWRNGSAEVNDEAAGITVTRLDIGNYLINGCTGLNADAAWCGIDGGFDIPMDRNKQPLIWLDYEVHADGAVLVKTYHRTHPSAPAWAQNIIAGYDDGDAIDIPADQYVSVRVEMPPNSAWNIRQQAGRDGN